MEILSMKKRSSFDNYTCTKDTIFDAFRSMTRDSCNKVIIKGVIYTLSNPIENLWFVHGFDFDGNELATASFDQWDL